jgi:16S rRNA (adenine1518-N6/adenine1519-N6)-dimethyltransferase
MSKRGARLGQHFLTTRAPALALARAADIRAGEPVLEIGPGKGALTRVLLTLSDRVIAIEKDDALAAKLKESFAGEIEQGKLSIVVGDIRTITPEFIGLTAGGYVVAANIPYYITGEIIRQFLTAAAQPRAMALLIQKEVAQRIVDKKESILSLSVKAYGEPRIVMKVSRKNFSPAPTVDSAVLAIHKISRDFFVDIDEQHFFDVVKAGFASKRKFLANNLAVKFGKEAVGKAFFTCSVPEKIRAENVGLAQWRSLAREL